jgi:Transposase family tnp2
MLLEFLFDLLPEGSKIPKSYYEAKKNLKDLGLNYIKIDACKNDCILFQKEFEHLDKCPTCGESRWKVDTMGDDTLSKKRKLIPQKVLRYFPLAPRLKRLYLNEEIANNMRCHGEGRNNDGVLRHPADALAWKDFDIKHPEFAAEIRNIRLGLASDGFVPFAINNNSHSIWSIILVLYNLPP